MSKVASNAVEGGMLAKVYSTVTPSAAPAASAGAPFHGPKNSEPATLGSGEGCNAAQTPELLLLRALEARRATVVSSPLFSSH